ncbi:BlaI/MecI/CopY family transcriptional regulator [Streptomyces camelliae]|uniref:BlaI/MecI/CopY family transcriptional regulator n=1 Tax=Streptomyces camelliae TaxID=3004093 RepID=A0ABY7PIU9_9ACTN|nr:BlaI/MecI/CopY family transcriptional regulator [Streptomyces sp. HUAS 2-6]WBO68358.1 BlaI/MecI/CopY family transcriptional regulator [Streptomyces sp. HUAS 2-6]
MTDLDPRRRRRAQGALETQVLAALHEAGGPVTAGWVQDHLAADLAYTTVMTVLARLLAKGAVTRRREGRSFLWLPAADEAGLAALKMRKVLDGEQDRRAVLASFITALPEGDEQVLRELLDQATDED